MKPQVGSQAAATKAHNCVGWPRRTGWKGEARPVPTGCAGGMTAAYSFLKSARYSRGCTSWNEDVESREGSRAPFCSSQDWKKLCVSLSEDAGPMIGQRGVIWSEVSKNKEGFHSKNPKGDSGLSGTSRKREARTPHLAETLQKWGHWPCSLKACGSDLPLPFISLRPWASHSAALNHGFLFC